MNERRESPPPPGRPRAYRFPDVERRTLGSGTRLMVAALTKAPLVSVTVVCHRAGAAQDPRGREGLAQLVASMLLEGTATRDGAAVAELFESLGSSLSAAADWDAASLGFTVHTTRLDEAVAALCDVLHAPAFAPAELSRLQEEHRAGRMQVMADPRELADAALARCCYDDESRYGRPMDGTMTSVASLSRDDLASFWRRQYAAGALTVVVAGDVTTGRAEAAAAAIATALPGDAPAERSVSALPRHASRRVTLVEKPNAAQAELRLGHAGVPRSHPSYFPLTVMNAVLGGLFSSRINLNLRERHGYTYGAFSGFDWRRSAGPWSVSTAVKTEVCGAAVGEVLAEIDRIRATEIEVDELKLAADYLTGVFPLRFETTSAVAAALASQATMDLPHDYFDTYRDHIASVSVTDVRQVAEDHLHPDQLQVVVVGDPAALRTDLAGIRADGLDLRTAEHVERAE